MLNLLSTYIITFVLCFFWVFGKKIYFGFGGKRMLQRMGGQRPRRLWWEEQHKTFSTF